MPSPASIATYSIVNGNYVIKDGNMVFDYAATHTEDFLLACYRHFEVNYPKFYKMDTLCKLGLLATEVLLKDNMAFTDNDPYHTGIVLSNANASLDADIKYYDTVANIPSPALFVYTLPNIVIGEISIKFSFKGENAFFIFDSFDAGFIATYVQNLFDTTALQQCICGWVDVIGDDYTAVLFLAVKKEITGKDVFTAANLNNIYLTSDGKS